MDFEEDTLLTKGKLMYYQHSDDVHIQYPPKSLSISINLVFPSHPGAFIQCVMNTTSGHIVGHLDVLPATTVLMKVARHLHDQSTSVLLEDISLKHCCPRTRTMTCSTLLQINPDNYEQINRHISNDTSRYVREYPFK